MRGITNKLLGLTILHLVSKSRSVPCSTPDGSCPSLFYLDLPTGECAQCPVGAVCAGGGIFPVPARGFWADFSDVATAVSEGANIHMHRCVFDTCEGGVDEENQILSPECWQQGSESVSTCSTDTLLCSEGSGGPLCQVISPIFIVPLITSELSDPSHRPLNLAELQTGLQLSTRIKDL
jgi:hypothetical protein